MTCAPYSASVRPIAGPAMIRQSSRTRIPDRTWGLVVGIIGGAGRGRGVRGEVSEGNFVSSHGGIERRFRPCQSCYLK
jgi:hypothetical protein